MRCPCCNQETKPARMLVSLDTNSVSFFNNVKVKTSPQIAAVLHVLNQSAPGTARLDALIMALHGGHGRNEPECALGALRALAHQARKLLKPFGFSVISVPTVGYRLGLVPKSHAARTQ